MIKNTPTCLFVFVDTNFHPLIISAIIILMPKRGRRRQIKLKIRKDTAKSVASVTLLVSAGLILVSYISPQPELNSKIQEYIKLAFGKSAVMLPVVLTVWGLLYVRALKLKFIELRVLFGLMGMLFSFSGIFHLFYSGEKAYEMAKDGLGGGLVGYKISQILSDLISIWGAGIILFAAIVISAIFVFDISFDEVLGFVKDLFGKVKGLKLFSAKKKELKEEDIKITSGSASLGEEGWEEAEEKTKGEALETSFEIIPSISEPQASGAPIREPLESEVISLAHGLPYSDRVWEAPPLDLLLDPASTPVDRGDVKSRAKIIEDTLKSFGIVVKVVEVNFGPAVTQYALEAESGTKIAKISNLQYDMALALASPTGSVRIEAPIPGRSLIGVEVPNNTRVDVHFKEMLTSEPMKAMKSKLGVVLGKDVSGNARVYDMNKMPHLLVAGATGSGKSVFLHSLIFSLLYRCSPFECKFILVDLKRVELIHYRDIPHLLTPVITELDKAAAVFKWAISEMKRRYDLLESSKTRNIDIYNEKAGFQALPYIIIVVDELAEIMIADPSEVEKSIIRLAQMARATGIHLVLTVQRPSTNVITGLIKANIPCRIAFNVASQVDSRVILDQPGAEKLLGQGDMLFVPPDALKPVRLQGALVAEKEISSLVSYLKSTGVAPDYRHEVLEMKKEDKSIVMGGSSTDPLFNEAARVVRESGKGSASLLQRRLSIGYARAARILDELEASGVVGPARGSKPREILGGSVSQNFESPGGKLP